MRFVLVWGYASPLEVSSHILSETANIFCVIFTYFSMLMMHIKKELPHTLMNVANIFQKTPLFCNILQYV